MTDPVPRTLVWYWATGGAGVRFSERVARCIAQAHGAANVALSLHQDNAWIERSRAGGHPVMTIGGASGHRNAAGIARQAGQRWLALRRQLEAFRPEVAVVPMNFALAWPLSLSLAWHRVPFVYVVHDAAPHPGDYMRLWQSGVQRRLVREAAALVALSNHVAGQLKASGLLRAGQPCEVIPLSAHDAAAPMRPREAGGGPLALLFLGRLLPYKGLALLAEALAPLRNDRTWRLTVAGHGPESAEVRALFAGFPQVALRLEVLREEDVDALIRDHDVMVCPYLEASQSGVIAEALYQGMPCLVTPVGGLPEQIGLDRGGVVAEAASPEALTQAVRGLLADPASISRLSAGALDLVRVACAGPAWGGLIETIAGRHHRPRSRSLSPDT